MVTAGPSAVRNQVFRVEFHFHRLPGKRPMHAAALIDTDRPLRSLAMLAAMAFVTGLLGYLAVTGWGMYRIVKAEIAAAPPTAGAWNLPKSI